uniref:glycoside hydrolase family 15 n=1 Tax=Prevotella sp. TaxID=59823 RepID=UPI004026C57A
MENLYELWGKRNPNWEKRYAESIIDVFTDYGRGTTQFSDDRGKIFGAGYEIFIIAFFIGLYSNQTKALTEDKSKIKSYGYPIKNWGNQENKLGRMSYSHIREYMFAALVARTDIDFIALDKGEITPQRVVDQLINKMEQYANFGFDYIHERMEEQPDCFFKEGAFLQLFLEFLNKEEQGSIDSNDDDSPEEI